MTDTNKTEAKKPAVVSFSMDDFGSADTAEMTVVVNGRPTDWTWTFAGPGHPKAEEQSNRISREALHQQRAQRQAQINGKKWREPEESVEDIRKRGVDYVIERLLGWSPVEINGQDYPFTEDNARALLSQPASKLLAQANDFLFDDTSFTKR